MYIRITTCNDGISSIITVHIREIQKTEQIDRILFQKRMYVNSSIIYPEIIDGI